MAINLKDFESGKDYDGDYDIALAKLEARLERIQVAHIIHGQSAIIAFEGWDASGKGGAIQRLTACWDPRYYEVWPIAAPTEEERVRHFLWRFWKRLPGAGEINVFDRTWYGRVLVERVEGFCTEKDWKRAFDEPIPLPGGRPLVTLEDAGRYITRSLIRGAIYRSVGALTR